MLNQLTTDHPTDQSDRLPNQPIRHSTIRPFGSINQSNRPFDAQVKLQEKRIATPSRTPTTLGGGGGGGDRGGFSFAFGLANTKNANKSSENRTNTKNRTNKLGKDDERQPPDDEGGRARDENASGGFEGNRGGNEGADETELEMLRAQAWGMQKEVDEQERLLSAYQTENEKLLDKAKKVCCLTMTSSDE